MNNILLILGGIWLLCGFIACWRDYHGYLKYWHETLGESYWANPNVNKKLAIVQFIFYCIMTCFGPIGLFSMEKNNDIHRGCWWYTTKKKK